MTTILDRMRMTITKSLEAVANATSVDNVQQKLDYITEQDFSELLEKEYKELVNKEFDNPKGKLNVYKKSRMMTTWYKNILGATYRISDKKLEDLPTDDPFIDHILAEFWKHEPMLAGAVYSMSAKMSTLSWNIVGRKNIVMPFADILDNMLSMSGRSWSDAISGTAQDFYTTNRGAFWYTERDGGNISGKLVEIGVMDSLCCALTGNPRKPVFYSSIATGQDLWLRPGEFQRYVSMPSPREINLGSGICAVFRAYKSARILLGLSMYDWEKLNNLPPEGVASVSGLSMDEFQDALALWRAARESNKSLTFPQVLWLIGSQPNSQVSVDLQSFSQMPESFNRRDVVEQYVNTLALVFGVDAREFWPISSGGLGTASESEIQHMKAKGKGPAEFLTNIERYLNGELPEDGGEFTFDTQDVGEDQLAASIAKGWIDAFMPLYAPGSGTAPSKTPMAPGVDRPEGGASQTNLNAGTGSGTEPLITKDQFLRLLVDRRVLPNWVVNDGKVIRTDIGITEKELANVSHDDNIVIRYKDGVFTYARPQYTLSNPANSISNVELPVARLIAQSSPTNGLAIDSNGSNVQEKQQPQPNIKGKPISDKEALRGPRVTKNTVKSEMELWLESPELAAYVATPDEHEYTQILNSVES